MAGLRAGARARVAAGGAGALSTGHALASAAVRRPCVSSNRPVCLAPLARRCRASSLTGDAPSAQQNGAPTVPGYSHQQTAAGAAPSTFTSSNASFASTAPSSRPAAAVSAAVSAAPRPGLLPGDLVSLVDEIQKQEADLAQMFQPGGFMPKASVVHRQREEIAAMRGGLEEMLQSTELQDIFDTEETSRARLCVMGALGAMPSEAKGSHELALLQAENAKLRMEAQVVLLRLQTLEEIAELLGLNVDSPQR